jgi:hypothetical protein
MYLSMDRDSGSEKSCDDTKVGVELDKLRTLLGTDGEIVGIKIGHSDGRLHKINLKLTK